ncbi:MAG: hypothetical protein RLZZ292_188 [Bacteroidota bacterium]|jgi:hypothetical protein
MFLKSTKEKGAVITQAGLYLLDKVSYYTRTEKKTQNVFSSFKYSFT